MFWKKTGCGEISREALAETDVVFPDFSAAQRTAEGFILVGTVHFNPGAIDFDEGRAEFALTRGRISAHGLGCVCEPESIAYVIRSDESQNLKVKVTKTRDSEKGGEAQVEAQAEVGLWKGFSAGGKTDGKLRHAFGKHEVRELTEETEGKRSLITAFLKKRMNGKVGQIDWLIEPDPLILFETSSDNVPVVIGERMRSASEDAGLARVLMIEPDGCIEMRLEVRAGDFHWTEIEFNELSPIHQHGKRLVDGREKRDIVGRLALGKILAGTVMLQRLPLKSGEN